jgi:hypothetical protein
LGGFGTFINRVEPGVILGMPSERFHLLTVAGVALHQYRTAIAASVLKARTSSSVTINSDGFFSSCPIGQRRGEALRRVIVTSPRNTSLTTPPRRNAGFL